MAEDENLKDRIIAAAWEKFRPNGFAKIRIDEITASLTISKKTFYKVFDSKEQLIEQMMNRLMGEVASNVERIVDSDASFVPKLSELLSFMATVPARVGVAMMQDVQRHLPHVWKRIEQFRAERIPQIFSRLLDQGVQEGYVRPDLNKRLFLLAYMAAIQHIVQPNVLVNEPFSARDAIRGIMELFFTGVMTERGRKEFSSVMSEGSSFTA